MDLERGMIWLKKIETRFGERGQHIPAKNIKECNFLSYVSTCTLIVHFGKPDESRQTEDSD